MKSIKSEVREILLSNDELGKNLGIERIVVRHIPWHDTVRINDVDENCLHQWDLVKESGDYYCEACRTWQEEITEDLRWGAYLTKQKQGVAK